MDLPSQDSKKSGVQPDGGFVLDDTTIDPPTPAEIRAMLRKKKQKQPKPPPPKPKQT